MTLVNNHTRESPALHVALRIRGIDVVGVLENVVDDRGKPGTIQVDNGPEFISKNLDLRACWNRVEPDLDFSRLGKPTDSDFIVF